MEWIKWLAVLVSIVLNVCVFFVLQWFQNLNPYFHYQIAFFIVAVLSLVILRHFDNFIYAGLTISVASGAFLYWVAESTKNMTGKVEYFGPFGFGVFTAINQPLIFIAEFLLVFNFVFLFYSLFHDKLIELRDSKKR